jgi:hypothetical protein
VPGIPPSTDWLNFYNRSTPWLLTIGKSLWLDSEWHACFYAYSSPYKKKRPEGWGSMPITVEKKPSGRCTRIINEKGDE